jgi:glycine cleavage system H protein
MAKQNPKDYKYTKTHEWIKVDGNAGVCGITDHAQHILTDIVFVELPAPGKIVAAGERVAVVESVKSVSDIYAPVSGEITAVNEKLKDAPELVNADAFGEGWIFKISASDTKELDKLLSRPDYEKSIAGEAH